MKIFGPVLIFFITLNLLYAKEEPKAKNPMAKLIYEQGYLINIGDKDILRLAITSPFYKYLGYIQKGKRVNVSYVKNKFTVQYTVRPWIGEYETMEQTFIPVFDSSGPDVGLDVKADLKGDILTVKVSSVEKIKSIYIEILSDIPIKVSNERIRYILSNVGVAGQSLNSGPEAKFKLNLLTEQDFYKVPIQITYVFQGSVYDKVFTFSFRKEQFDAGSSVP